jgi:hypothetical protein
MLHLKYLTVGFGLLAAGFVFGTLLTMMSWL